MIINRSTSTGLAAAMTLLVATASALAAAPTQTALASQAKVSEASARMTALSQVRSGSVASSELEKEHGKLIWSFDITSPGSTGVTEVQVDAKSGALISKTTETAQDEADEAIAEHKGAGQ